MKLRNKLLAVSAVVASASACMAQTAPTSLDGFTTIATDYIGDGTTVAIAAGVLSLGWVAFRIVKKYASKA